MFYECSYVVQTRFAGVRSPCPDPRGGAGAVVPCYIIEPEYWALPDTSARQWAMTAEALVDLRDQLGQIGAPLVVRTGDAVEVLDRLCKRHGVTRIVSHQETGNAWSYERDLRVAAWARDRGIIWEELQASGVRRGSGAVRRDLFMAEPLLDAPQIRAVAGLEAGPIPRHLRLADDPCPYRQIGGRGQALALMDSFRAGRVMGYARGMAEVAAAWLPGMMNAYAPPNPALMQALTDMVIRMGPDVHARQLRALLTRPDAGASLAYKGPMLLMTTVAPAELRAYRPHAYR